MKSSARTLTECLWHVFALTRAEQAVAEGIQDATLPSLPLVRGRYAALERAWAACPEPMAVYRTELVA